MAQAGVGIYGASNKIGASITTRVEPFAKCHRSFLARTIMICQPVIEVSTSAMQTTRSHNKTSREDYCEHYVPSYSWWLCRPRQT
jgi:hypothetical protein